ncbi:uncharacterized protein LOC143277912 [Babylonia areolata]|uniref:uncharacterized protein LOC143277912 n=1 Tax=Babylonia areolata TaxID=304850 RepID=UPI003FCFAC13
MPQDEDRHRAWRAAVYVKNPPKLENFYVCSFHFVDRRPSEDHPDPELFLGFPKKVSKLRKLQRDNAASQLKKPKAGDCSAETSGADLPAEAHAVEPLPNLSEETEDSGSTDRAVESTTAATTTTSSSSGGEMHSVGTQWVNVPEEDHEYSQPVYLKYALKNDDKQVQTSNVTVDVAVQVGQIQSSLFATLIRTEKDSKLYTGIPLSALHMLIQCMEPHKNVSFGTELSDQILMALMKLKLNLLLADLARRFDVSESVASRIINYWIDTLVEHF